jgi:hypothetical protein
MTSMLGQPASFTTVLAAERHARFAAEAADARWRRQRRQPHPAPPCANLATQLPEVVIDLAGDADAAAEPTAAR